MKTIRLLQSQFIHLNEGLNEVKIEDIPTINVVANSPADVGQKGNEAATTFANNGGNVAKIKVTTNKNDLGDELEVTGKEGNSVTQQLTSAVDDTITSGMNPNTTTYSTVVDGGGLPIKKENEGKVYKKKKVEESRLYNLKKNGKTYTKGELNKILSKKK